MPVFAVRDDDINAFTDASMLRRVYLDELSFLRPSLCLTPLAGEIYRKILENETNLPTREHKLLFASSMASNVASATNDWRRNYEILPVLKELLSRGSEICLHGVNHNPTAIGFECESPVPDVKIVRALLNEIESELDTTIRVFSPPNNSIVTAWLDLLYECNLSMVTSVGVRPNECGWAPDALFSILRILPKHLASKGHDRSWSVCRYRRVKTVQSFPISVFSKRAEVLAALHSAHRRNRDFVLAIHSYQFNEPNAIYQLFVEVCEEARTIGYDFGTISEILDRDQA
jgi:hypothetical protein